MKNDPRVTKFGQFLRRFSLDEVPQLINVLRGEMSLVGPRPQVVWEAAQYDDWAKKRLNVLPGITGLWQVSGRAELTYEEMIDLDIFYIEQWSPGMDIKILLKTLPAVLFAKGAY
jgi:lipopolysaccharide/colanic/teichoic acid biosynthesis glycosyltransferase